MALFARKNDFGSMCLRIRLFVQYQLLFLVSYLNFLHKIEKLFLIKAMRTGIMFNYINIIFFIVYRLASVFRLNKLIRFEGALLCICI